MKGPYTAFRKLWLALVRLTHCEPAQTLNIMCLFIYKVKKWKRPNSTYIKGLRWSERGVCPCKLKSCKLLSFMLTVKTITQILLHHLNCINCSYWYCCQCDHETVVIIVIIVGEYFRSFYGDCVVMSCFIPRCCSGTRIRTHVCVLVLHCTLCLTYLVWSQEAHPHPEFYERITPTLRHKVESIIPPSYRSSHPLRVSFKEYTEKDCITG